MTQTFQEYLESEQLNTNTILEAGQLYLAEQTDYLPPEEMRRELVEVVGDEAAIDALLSELSQDRASLENASLLLLSSAWADPEGREHVQAVMADTGQKLAVVEVGILAIAAMYMSYLLITKGKLVEKEVTVRRPEGGYETTKYTEYAPPTGPLRAVASLVTGVLPSGGKDDPDDADTPS